MITNMALAGLFAENMSALGQPIPLGNEETMNFSTDVGNVSQLVPAIQPLVSITPGDVLIHTPEFAKVAATDKALDINGRDIRARKCAKGVAWFDFDDICDGPRSQADYIEIARWYPAVIVAGVPRLDRTLEDQARRFIALVDEFYDRRVKLVLSADAAVDSLYAGERLRFEFDRTVSRLVEMQSNEYLALPHLA